MGCEQALEWMMETLDRDLDPAGRAVMEDHLAHCADCRAEWDRLQALEWLLRDAPTVRPPTGFAGRVLARLDRRQRLKRVFLGGMALSAGAAIIAFLMLAPAVWTLSGLTDGLLALSDVGRAMIGRLADATATVLSSLWLTAGALAFPALSLAFCGLAMALVANLLWLGFVRRLQPVRTTHVRR